MARGTKTGGKDFTPGHNSPGPGRPKLIPEAVGLPRLDRENYGRMLNHAMHCKKEELAQTIADPEQPMIKKWLATIVARGTQMGDTKRLEDLLTRAIGPAPKQVEIGNIDQKPFKISAELENLTDQELKEHLKTILKEDNLSL